MAMADDVAALRKAQLFRRVDPQQLRMLALMSTERVFRDGEVFIREGDDGEEAHILLSGAAVVFVGEDESELPVAEIRPYEIIGEMAILCDAPRAASVRARGETRTLCIAKAPTLKMLREFPDMALEMMRVLATRTDRTTRELAAFTRRVNRG